MSVETSTMARYRFTDVGRNSATLPERHMFLHNGFRPLLNETRSSRTAKAALYSSALTRPLQPRPCHVLAIAPLSFNSHVRKTRPGNNTIHTNCRASSPYPFARSLASFPRPPSSLVHILCTPSPHPSFLQRRRAPVILVFSSSSQSVSPVPPFPSLRLTPSCSWHSVSFRNAASECGVVKQRRNGQRLGESQRFPSPPCQGNETKQISSSPRHHRNPTSL